MRLEHATKKVTSVNIMWPCYVNQNDVEIMKHIIDDLNGLSSLIKPEDVFVVDRGLREVSLFEK